MALHTSLVTTFITKNHLLIYLTTLKFYFYPKKQAEKNSNSLLDLKIFLQINLVK